MKLVMTLLVRNEADIVRDNVEFHLRNGVDHIVAMDNGSVDGTTEILSEYEAAGVLSLFREPSEDFHAAEWRTRLAHIARESCSADWVITNDADEFWRPPARDLKEVLKSRQEQALWCRRVNMVNCVEGLSESKPWHERLLFGVRKPCRWPALQDHLKDPLPNPYFYLPLPGKIIARTQGFVAVAAGGHAVEYEGQWDQGDCDVTIYHFPVRSKVGFERSVRQIGSAVVRNRSLKPEISWKYRRWYQMLVEDGTIDRAFAEVFPGCVRLRIDALMGRVARDTCIRDDIAALQG
jgi:glycosyltransferase involved in cell wall biosynthesis